MSNFLFSFWGQTTIRKCVRAQSKLTNKEHLKKKKMNSNCEHFDWTYRYWYDCFPLCPSSWCGVFVVSIELPFLCSKKIIEKKIIEKWHSLRGFYIINNDQWCMAWMSDVSIYIQFSNRNFCVVYLNDHYKNSQIVRALHWFLFTVAKHKQNQYRRIFFLQLLLLLSCSDSQTLTYIRNTHIHIHSHGTWHHRAHDVATIRWNVYFRDIDYVYIFYYRIK